MDLSGRWVLHTVDMSVNLRIHLRILEGKRRVDEPAVDHLESLDIAQALQALDRAVLEYYIAGIPPEILATDVGVLHDNIVTVPEGILRTYHKPFEKRALFKDHRSGDHRYG